MSLTYQEISKELYNRGDKSMTNTLSDRVIFLIEVRGGKLNGETHQKEV